MFWHSQGKSNQKGKGRTNGDMKSTIARQAPQKQGEER